MIVDKCLEQLHNIYC